MVTRHAYRATDPISVQHVREQTAAEIAAIIGDTLEAVGAVETEGTPAFNARVFSELWHNELADVREWVGDQTFHDYLSDVDWSSTKLGAQGIAAALAEQIVPADTITRVRTPGERVGGTIGPTASAKTPKQTAQDDAATIYGILHQVMGFDQTLFAEQLGISVATLHNYRNGRTAPRITKAQARHLAATCDYLAGQLRIAADKAQELAINPHVKD